MIYFPDLSFKGVVPDKPGIGPVITRLNLSPSVRAEGSGTTAGVGCTRAACEACILLFERRQTWSDGPLISRVVLANGQGSSMDVVAYPCLGIIQDNKIIGHKVQMFQVQRSICKLVGMNPTVVNSKGVMKKG